MLHDNVKITCAISWGCLAKSAVGRYSSARFDALDWDRNEAAYRPASWMEIDPCHRVGGDAVGDADAGVSGTVASCRFEHGHAVQARNERAGIDDEAWLPRSLLPERFLRFDSLRDALRFGGDFPGDAVASTAAQPTKPGVADGTRSQRSARRTSATSDLLISATSSDSAHRGASPRSRRLRS